MCDFYQVYKNEDEMENHLKRCFEKKNLIKSKNCAFCYSNDFISSTFFIFCHSCYKTVFCLRCEKEIEQEKCHVHPLKCFKNWAQEDYFSEKKQIDEKSKNFYVCKFCGNACSISPFSETDQFFFCPMCDQIHFCRKCEESLNEKNLKDHLCKIK